MMAAARKAGRALIRDFNEVEHLQVSLKGPANFVSAADKKAEEIEPHDGRRGWGLKLMKNLMDEVKMEQTDDGTRISMVKYLK